MKMNGIFWGIFWIVVGCMFLLNITHVINLSWASVLRAWPFIIIFIGVSLLPMKDWYRLGLLLLTLLGMVWFVISDSRNDNNMASIFATVSSVSGKCMEVEVEQDGVFGKLEIDGGAIKLRSGDTCSPLMELISSTGHVERIELASAGKNRVRTQLDDEGTRTIDLRLNPTIEWAISTDFGAADLNLDLRNYKVREFEINGGASNVKVQLGTLQTYTKVDISSGVAKVELWIPEAAYCEVTAESALSGRDFQGFEKINGQYKTPNRDQATQRIVVDIEGGLSSFSIRRY